MRCSLVTFKGQLFLKRAINWIPMTESSFSFRQNWIWTSGPSNVRRGLYNWATQLFIFVLKMLHLSWSSELRLNASSDGDIVRKRYVIRKTDLCYKISLTPLQLKGSVGCNMPYLTLEQYPEIQTFHKRDKTFSNTHLKPKNVILKNLCPLWFIDMPKYSNKFAAVPIKKE